MKQNTFYEPGQTVNYRKNPIDYYLLGFEVPTFENDLGLTLDKFLSRYRKELVCFSRQAQGHQIDYDLTCHIPVELRDFPYKGKKEFERLE